MKTKENVKGAKENLINCNQAATTMVLVEMVLTAGAAAAVAMVVVRPGVATRMQTETTTATMVQQVVVYKLQTVLWMGGSTRNCGACMHSAISSWWRRPRGKNQSGYLIFKLDVLAIFLILQLLMTSSIPATDRAAHTMFVTSSMILISTKTNSTTLGWGYLHICQCKSTLGLYSRLTTRPPKLLWCLWAPRR